ncbi:MAG TPA: hypothetical protein VGE41_03780 [Verrucomicrobiae bacterium]
MKVSEINLVRGICAASLAADEDPSCKDIEIPQMRLFDKLDRQNYTPCSKFSASDIAPSPNLAYDLAKLAFSQNGTIALFCTGATDNGHDSAHLLLCDFQPGRRTGSMALV